MNASFAILQKLKGQFLQSVSNKSDFHVAFAPLAFTLSSDDFYFLKGTGATGAEARKYLREQSEFAILANSVLHKPHIWRIDSEGLLYDAYRSILNTAKTIDPDALSIDEQARLNKAKAVLFTKAGKDSAKYAAYKKYAAKAADAEKKLIDHAALKASIPETDRVALARWDVDLQTLTTAKRDALIDWQANGSKSAIESAKATYDDVVFGKAGFVQRWLDARSSRLGPPNLLTDEYGVDFLATTCIPNSIGDTTAPIWKKISIGKAEISQLTKDFTDGTPASILTEFGDLQPDIDAITFEYCLIDILRPWFDESLINNRLWKSADDSLKVSSGDDSMTGQIPAYPVKIILAKNIELVFTPNSAVNEDIKVRLQTGSRLVFGPLLLKTIPGNLAADKITALRVQQLSTPELAVLTKVALAAETKPAAFNGGKRLEMLQLLNNRPQPLMRINAPMFAAVPAALSRGGAPAAPAAAGLSRAGEAAAGPGTRAAMATFAGAPMGQAHAAVMPGMFLPVRPTVALHTGFLVGTPISTIAQPPSPPDPPPTRTTADVIGRVLSAANAPLAIAEIQIMNIATAATQSMLTLEDGSYAFRGIDSARYHVKVRKAGYVIQEKDIDAVGTSTQDFLLDVQAVPTESFQVIGVICKRLPKLPDPLPGASYV